MINPYEMISKSALPALRAMVAKRLQSTYGLTQQQVAQKLGVTQASVSNYSRRARGVMLNLDMDPVVAKAADSIAATLAADNPDQRQVMRAMTEVLDYIRFNHSMCTLHRDLEPGFPVEGCEACDGAFSSADFGHLKVPAGR